MNKILYYWARESFLLKLPLLRTLRNKIYGKIFNMKKCNIGDGVYFHTAHSSDTISLSVDEGLHIGQDSYIDYSGGIRIGRNVTISERVQIFTHYHMLDGQEDWRLNPIAFSSLEINEFVWIGAGAIINPKVNVIGKGAVIGSGAVVTKDVPDMVVVAGNPARFIRERRIG